jgi:hypothetical protein
MEQVAAHAVDVGAQEMRSRQRGGLDLCYLLGLAVLAVPHSVAVIAVAVEQVLLQPVVAVACAVAAACLVVA